LSAAQPYFNNANVDPSQLAQGYMSPYTQDVVNSIGTLGQRNIQQNLAPQATAGAVGTGQFGSQRGAQVLGQTIQNANTDILAQQNQALQAGYTQALAAAQKQQQLEAQLGQSAATASAQGQTNLVNAANVGSTLAGQKQALGLADVNALANLGGQQQTIAQNAQLFPLSVLSQQAKLLQGANIPTTTTATYQGSPLSAIASLGATTAGLFQTPITGGATPFSNLLGSIKTGATDLSTALGLNNTQTPVTTGMTSSENSALSNQWLKSQDYQKLMNMYNQNPQNIGQTEFNNTPQAPEDLGPV
jgi:hypothetical protein